MYDGPFCVLSIVDNRTFKRLSYHVLDRDPTQVDIEAFFRRFRQALEARGLTVQGITTDGSTLYPEPIAAVFGAVPHQVCQFHILHEVNKAILSAVAQERKRLAAGAPKLPRGRPSSKAAKRAARRKNADFRGGVTRLIRTQFCRWRGRFSVVFPASAICGASPHKQVPPHFLPPSRRVSPAFMLASLSPRPLICGPFPHDELLLPWDQTARPTSQMG